MLIHIQFYSCSKTEHQKATERLAKLEGILVSGETAIQLTLQFLYSHNNGYHQI